MSQITTVLFDLDGTLLPMDQDVFVKAYFSRIAAKMAPRGYEPKALIDAIWAGTMAMVKNDGSCTNEQAFWATFAAILGEKVRAEEPVLREFYKNEFQNVQKVCGYHPSAAEIVRDLRERGIRVVLATNPIFPAVATESRIRWAGLEPEDFELYTTYENSRYCKPTLAYYEDILATLGVSGEECVMVGNDVSEDMVTERLGMKTFLLTDCLINKNGEDISKWAHGGFEELKEFLMQL
ncbi:MAG: HAD family hydrolase [Clostridia bacterium]|nr:HAD family hydrolase [Clostridia bacterium]